jgi:hypothetical protein
VLSCSGVRYAVKKRWNTYLSHLHFLINALGILALGWFVLVLVLGQVDGCAVFADTVIKVHRVSLKTSISPMFCVNDSNKTYRGRLATRVKVNRRWVQVILLDILPNTNLGNDSTCKSLAR